MPDFEDMILPDDFQADTTPEETVEPETIETEEPVETVEDTTPTETTEPTLETPQTLKLKYNKEEREIPIDEAVLLAQKGMNLEKAVERAKQEARDSYIAEQGFEWNGEPITTEAQFNQAKQEQQWMEEYQNRDLPPEIIEELIKGRQFREESLAEKKAKAEEEKINTEYNKFFEYFREANGREYVPTQDVIPQNVWDAVNQGEPLKFAYMAHENSQLRTQLSTLKQNQSNAQKAPVGSVTAHGGTEVASEDDFMKGFNSI
jgi:hypothetical protein